MKSNAFAKNVISICSKAKRVAISGHQNPDYDALGSCLAMREILAQNGVQADILLEQPLDSTFTAFSKDYQFVISPEPNYDVLILVDTAEVKLIPPYIQGVFGQAKVTINIDHHQSNTFYAGLNFVLPNRSSACEVLFELFKKRCTLNREIAKFLYIGIYTDTGGFVYSNTHKSTMLCLAELMDTGLQAEKLLQICFKNKSRSAFEITKRAFASVKFYYEDKIAVSVLRYADFSETKANLNEAKYIVPYLPTIDGVLVSISVSEPQKGEFHVSMRTAFDNVNVSKIAEKFGGGGHKRASGLTLKGDFDKALNALIAHTKYVLENGEN